MNCVYIAKQRKVNIKGCFFSLETDCALLFNVNVDGRAVFKFALFYANMIEFTTGQYHCTG